MLEKTVVSGDTVQIVGRKLNSRGYKQGFVVVNGDKRQEATALEWAGENPDIDVLDNKDFEIELVDAANNSSQSGKLSFWNCLITKGEKSYLIGINSQLLLDLMKHTTFVNGKCKSKVAFIRVNSQLGVFTENMPISKELAEANKQKHELKANYVKKFEIGHVYESLQTRQVYLGELYSWVRVEKSGWRLKVIEVLRNPVKTKLFVSASNVEIFGATSIAELFENAGKAIQEKDASNQWYAKTLLDRGNLLKGSPKRVDAGEMLANTEYKDQFNQFNQFTASLWGVVNENIGVYTEKIKARYNPSAEIYLENALELVLPIIAYKLQKNETTAEQVYAELRKLMPSDTIELKICMEEK